MSRMNGNTLQLNRTFLQVPETVTGLDAEATLGAALLLNKVESWETLLEHPYVVVLGEAGTGKTTEFRLQSGLMAKQGRFSFVVELRDLAEQGLNQSLDVKDESLLEQWRESRDDATFFLDSLDEAKLGGRTLKHALRSLNRDLKGQWDRVRLVISCRASDWLPDSDRDELLSVAPVPEPKVHIVQLAPLNDGQVERLARAAGVTDVAEFMSAVAYNYAHVFIERPLDVQWLGSYWVQHRSIGSLRELIAENIREKLRERPGKRETVVLTNAEAGLQTLAGVAMINNSWAFVVPDEPLDVHRGAGAVCPQEFLPDWSSDEIAELLRRPVFDEATYGRVRLHHRSVQEFLAARWLHGLVSRGLDCGAVEELIFRQVDGDRVIPAHVRPVAAWLALWDAHLRSLLIREAPAVLIGQGDPSGFTDEVRQDILASYARSYQGRERRFESFDSASLQRFSAPALSGQIEALLKKPDTSDDLASFLLEVVYHGRISSCADTCLAIALDLSRNSYTRWYAIRAFASIGADTHKAKLLELLNCTPVWEQDLAGAFVRALYPEPLKVDGLMRLLATTEPSRRNSTTSLQVMLEYEVPQIGPVTLRLELISQLVGALWQLDSEGGARMVPHQQQWLLPLAAKLVAGLLDELPVRGERPSVIMAALDMFRWCNERGMYIAHGLAEVKKAVERHPCVRRALFWQRVEEHRQEKGSTPTRYFELRCSYELFELSNADHSWLTVDAKARPNVQERLLAFDVLSKTPVTEATPHAHLELLREVAEESPELTRRLSRMLNPPALPIPPISRKWERQARATMLARERHDASNRAELDRRLEQIRDGSDLGALRFLYDNAGLDHSSGEVIAVELLEEKFGRRIAEAAVAGFRAFWRTYDPPLPHERERRDSTPYGVVLGLAGLSLDFARGLDASTMSVTHARLAARYAASELNALPAWLSDLAAAHPAAVADTLGPAVAADLAHPDDGTQIYDVLAKLPRAPEVVKQVLAPCVAQQLRAVEPPTVEALQYALDVLLSLHMSMAQDLSGLAPERCRRAINAPERMAAWWEAWLSVEPNGALDFLESAIREVSPERAYQIVLKVCHRFYDCSMFHATRPLHVRSQPEALRRLIPLVYQYIKPDDDIVHERMYSPGVRDHAQEVRSHLITWLSEISGREALQSLRALAGDPRLAALRDWLLHLAEQRLVSSAGLARPTVVERLTELCKAHGTNLATHLDELREERPMERIDVGIVTMKEEEYDALLDKFGATTVRRGTNRDYDVVRVETKRGACAVAITRCAQQGNTFAQTAATEMLSDLNPRFLLVVGIAGGVPSPDFCLGDVIVSNYIQDLTLEDTGVRPGNERYNALGGPLHPSASRILERLRAVERCAVSWSSASSIACERPPLGGEYTTDDETWNASIDEALRRLNGRKEPIGTAQKVASSDRLIKAPELLQKWRQVLKAVAAVEMESAGAYLCCQRNDTPFMAIRGISDIVGWRREDAWTLYACHTAAAYTKMLVSEGVFVDERAASG